MKPLELFAIVLGLGAFQAQSSTQPLEITTDEVTTYIATQKDCSEDSISIDSMELHDFAGDGKKEAVVVASSCATGTAGPDVHTVFTRDAQGALIEVPILVSGESTRTDGGLFGNVNSEFSIENGLLVDTYHDTSDRDHPLVIRYKWTDKGFVIQSFQSAPTYKASYDCSKATREVDRAICHVETLADLDLEMARLYKIAFEKATPSERTAIKNEQRKWLADRDARCIIYKGWVYCLQEAYEKRIGELKQNQ